MFFFFFFRQLKVLAALPAVLFAPQIQLIIASRPVGEQNDLPPAAELGGNSQAEREGLQAERLQWVELHVAVAGLLGKHQRLDGTL